MELQELRKVSLIRDIRELNSLMLSVQAIAKRLTPEQVAWNIVLFRGQLALIESLAGCIFYIEKK